ncbi:MAG TPA: 4'-phosphopantetheinyl transferase superfamily protein [Flavisolibacter sp.]|nr:4'-phosphopantetheinyl transferase superfamily protein [Flavisolibacter sp.]
MPIFYQQDIDQDTKVGIWKIEEEEDFFLKKVMPQRQVSHPHKKLQHLAGRYLLNYLYPGFPVELIQIADTRKPFLENEKYHFSIAHCGNYAAAIVSRVNRVGVDAEIISDKIMRIRSKFISEEEEFVLNGPTSWLNEQEDIATINNLAIDTSLLTLVWSVKEAVFKWYGLGGLEFREHMMIKSIAAHTESQFEVVLLFKKNEELFLNLQVLFFGDLCLCYVLT